MSTPQYLTRKSNRKSRPSSAHKSQISQKSLNQKQKIINAIKKSTLDTTKSKKPKIYSNKKYSNTEKKKKSLNSYQVQSQRHRVSRTISTISKSMPVKHPKQKILQFPFAAIKFKQKVNEQFNQSKSHEGFYIQYDEPEITQINMSVFNNSKKIVGSYNQRVGRYNQLRGKQKNQFGKQMRNTQFKQSLIKLFKFLDPNCTRVISHAQIDYRKVPQAVLYFLGGLFQRIRQRNLYLSQKQFLEESNLIYMRSSNQDVKWFIEEIQYLHVSGQKSTSIFSQQKTMSNSLNGLIHKDFIQELNTQQNQKSSKLPQQKQSSYYNNLSFDKQECSISFRKDNDNNNSQYRIKTNIPSERQSFKSAQFGILIENRFSLSSNGRKQFQIDFQKQNSTSFQKQGLSKQMGNKRDLFLQYDQSEIEIIRTVGIKKNVVNKAEDLRQQIYAKLDKMKISNENKENYLLRDNFKMPLAMQTTDQKLRNNILKNREQCSDIVKIKDFQKSQNSVNVNIKQSTPLSEKKLNSIIQPEQRSQLVKAVQKVEHQNFNDSKWVSKMRNCQKAFEQLQKIKNQFQTHKNSIQQKQIQKSSYFKDQYTKGSNCSDFILQEQTRVLKFKEKETYQQRIQKIQNNSYQRNIDRLTNLAISRNKNSHSIKLNETLVHSCRKSVEISLPLKCDAHKGISCSQKKVINSQKIDKIEELSQKLEKYLKTNAQKIQYSKNFTQIVGDIEFNKILAV